MALKVSNNASSTIAGSINSVVTAINLAGGTGSLFPTLAAGDWFWGTLVDASNNIEVVKVTARSTDALTVVRGQDGTTAKSYTVGDRFELRPTAALFNDKADIDNPSFTTKITTPAITLGATALTATGTELNYVSGVTSPIQTQLDAKAPTTSPTFTGTVTVADLTSTGVVDLSASVLKGATPLAFDGLTAGTSKTTVSVTDPTANRTLTIPDADVDLAKVRPASTTLDGVSRFATTNEATAWNASPSNSIACTPFSLSGVRAFTTAGYQRLPGGLLIQWNTHSGMPDVGSGINSIVLTFPMAFPNGLLCVIPVTTFSPTVGTVVMCAWDNSFSSLSQTKISFWEWSAAVQGPWSISYIAIGY